MAKKNAGSLLQIRDTLNLNFKEREDLVDGMITAVLAKENLFLLGPPGTAKSAICEALCSAIQGNYFAWLISKFTTPEELFGAPSLSALKQDRYTRITTGKLPEAHIALGDEIFKGSSAILNTLLPILNERKFYNDGKPTNIPLQVFFGASNELPQSDELGALYDRFALRYEVLPMEQEASVEALFKGQFGAKMPSITLDELAKEQAAAANVKVPDEIVKILVKLRKEINGLAIYVSDRKWVQSIRVLKAYAHLNGHTEVQEDDIQILGNMLWSIPTQKPQIRKTIAKFANPMGEEILKVMDGCQEAFANFQKNEKLAMEANQKIKAGIAMLRKLDPKKQNNAVEKAIEQLKALNLKVLQQMGLEGLQDS